MNSVAKKWQETANERLMLMQKLSAQHAEIAKLKAQDKAQKADIRDWMNEGQQQQKIATEVYAEKAKLKELLVEVAGIAHHGALLGFKTIPEAQTKICRLTVDYWDRDECSRLQSDAAK